MKHLKKFFKGENWEKCRALTLFDLFKSFKGDLFFFMVVAMIALGIIKCQTVSKKLGDFSYSKLGIFYPIKHKGWKIHNNKYKNLPISYLLSDIW